MKIKTFREVAQRYKAIFFDSFGVVKHYSGLISGVHETFHFLDEAGIEYLMLTNVASRSPQQMADGFARLGLPQITTDRIISSGMMAQEYLRYKVRDGKAVYVGTENSAHYIAETGLQIVSIEDLDLAELDDINALVFLDDEGYDWRTAVNKSINLLRKKNIPVVVANTDVAYPVSRGELAMAIGGLAEMIEKVVNKNFIHFGKPDGQMFIYAYQELLKRKQIRKDEILMVGDTLYTDIIGGNKFGIDTALVLSGNTQPKNAKSLIKNMGIKPDYICESIALSTPDL
ncbi:MAG: HAD-IIA family hydrolase [Cyanothece sp. SIO1E1]|nr:HAD-IIA family hydrolase [Cyanothece sp. SIO1E1]